MNIARGFNIFLILSSLLLFSGCSFAYDCQKEKGQIREEISTINYCSVDDDCRVADFDCPFGNELVNKNADLAEVKKLINQYQKNCGTCMYDIVAPKKNEIKCRAKKCVDARQY